MTRQDYLKFPDDSRNHDIKVGFDYVGNTMRTYNVDPSVAIWGADTAYARAKYGITSYGSLEDIPTWRYRVYADGYGYDLYGNESDNRTFYYSDVDGVSDRDTMYIDGAKATSEMGFFIQIKLSLMILLLTQV